MKYTLNFLLSLLCLMSVVATQGQPQKRQQPNTSTNTRSSSQPNLAINQFELSSKSLNFGEREKELYFEITNNSNSNLKFSLYGNANWFSASIINGDIKPHGKQRVAISVNRNLIKNKQSLELEVETKYGSKFITLNVDKPNILGSVISCDKKVDFSIRSVETVGDRVYIQFIMTNNSDEDWGGSFNGGVFHFGNVNQTGEFRSSAARDNAGNIYPLSNTYGKRMSVKISGKTAYGDTAVAMQAITLNGGGSSVEGEIAIGGIAQNATMITEVKFGTFLQSAGTRRDFAYDFVKFINIPIKR